MRSLPAVITNALTSRRLDALQIRQQLLGFGGIVEHGQQVLRSQLGVVPRPAAAICSGDTPRAANILATAAPLHLAASAKHERVSCEASRFKGIEHCAREQL